MKSSRLMLLAASFLIPTFVLAQAPAPSAEAQKDKQDTKDNDAARKDIQANVAEAAASEAKIKDSHAGEAKALKANRAEEKSDLADAAKDKTLGPKAKKTKKAAILKNKKAARKATREQADAERKPLEKDVRLDNAAVKDAQTVLDAKQAAEKK